MPFQLHELKITAPAVESLVKQLQEQADIASCLGDDGIQLAAILLTARQTIRVFHGTRQKDVGKLLAEVKKAEAEVTAAANKRALSPVEDPGYDTEDTDMEGVDCDPVEYASGDRPHPPQPPLMVRPDHA